MQQERDDLDIRINASIEKISVSSDYNQKLISKLNKRDADENARQHFYKSSTAALSLIISGMLFILINVTSLNNVLFNINGKVKSQFLAVQYEYNYKLENIKNNIGDGH